MGQRDYIGLIIIVVIVALIPRLIENEHDSKPPATTQPEHPRVAGGTGG